MVKNLAFYLVNIEILPENLACSGKTLIYQAITNRDFVQRCL